MSTTATSSLRVLVLAPTTPSQDQESSSSSPSPFIPLLTALTSLSPSTDLTTFAGYTSHPPLHLKTRYYERKVGIWCDELPAVQLSKRRGTGASTSSAGELTSPIISMKPELENIEEGPGPAVPSTPTSSQPPQRPVASPTEAMPATSFNPLSSPSSQIAPVSSAVQQAPEPTLKEYKAQFLSSEPDAQEVLGSIGAIILILPIPSSPTYPSTPAEKVSLMEYMSAVNEIKDAIEDIGGGRNVGSLFVLQPSVPSLSETGDGREAMKRIERLAETFEDKCHEMGVFGWDFVAWDGIPPAISGNEAAKPATTDEISTDAIGASKRNQYGEKQGLARVLEVLEAVNWSAPSLVINNGADDEPSKDDDDDFDVFSSTKYKGLDAELQQEMMGLKLSMLQSHNSTGTGSDGDAKTSGLGLAPEPGMEGEDMSIEQMSKLMERVVAIKEAGSEMGKEERETFAKREVERLMRDL